VGVICRGQLKCDGTRAETRFRLSAKRTSPFKLGGTSVQSTTGNRGVRISGSNAGYTVFRGSVKGTGYPLHSPVSSSLPLPCVTVCHHISIGVYLLEHLEDNNQQHDVRGFAATLSDFQCEDKNKSFYFNYCLGRSLEHGTIRTNLPNFGHVLKIPKKSICFIMTIYPALGQQLQSCRINCDENRYGRNPLNFVEPLKFAPIILRIILPKNVNSLARLSTDFS